MANKEKELAVWAERKERAKARVKVVEAAKKSDEMGKRVAEAQAILKRSEGSENTQWNLGCGK